MKRQALGRTARRLAAALVLSAALLPGCAGRCAPQQTLRETGPDATALDRYVAAPDPAYRWEPVRTLKADRCLAHVLKMTSQTWLTPNDVDRTEWWHWLTIVEPEKVTSDVALLFLHGGDNEDGPPDQVRPALAKIAQATGTVVAELRMVPNQPLRFTGDSGSPRKEDRLIAYAWAQFLRGGDPVWLPRLPMTKSAVRAMDTVTAYFEKRGAAGERGEGDVRVNRFVVVGASKRGWTTWTTGAVDRRVVAIIPMVIDLLNLEESFQHHFEVYGFWAPAIKSYVEMGIPDWFGKPEMRRLREIEDPYSYRARLSMPKMIVNATGDQFFVPDSSRFYFDGLPGEKHLRYVPNVDHSMRQTDAEETVLAFYRAIVRGTPRPEFTWTFEPDGSIQVRTASALVPSGAKLWQATNSEARDFRLETLGAKWSGADLARQPDGGYLAKVETPASGFTAFFVELTYASGDDGPPLKLTTEVRVLPEKLPFAGARS
jgi:PhoPQ-activated pathogenicity-related protein